MINVSTNSEKFPSSPWSIIDILGVLCCVFVVIIITFILSVSFLDNDRASLRIFRYVTSIATLGFPLLWVKKRYGLTHDALGLRKGRYSLAILFLIGISTALIFTILARISPFWRPSILSEHRLSEYHIYLILLPISIDGFLSVILTPIGEEIMDRGFIYGYLRRKLGVIWGLNLQALIFSLLHVDFVFGDALYLIGFRFVEGLILGILYEKTGSLYTSIICHGLINYFAIIFSLTWS